MKYFETRLLEEAAEFIAGFDPKTVRKILFTIDLAEQTNDPKLFKKLREEIWEFRIAFSGQQIRLLAFWDKTDKTHTLVIATHGFLKKTDKTPGNEIVRALRLKNIYFANNKK